MEQAQEFLSDALMSLTESYQRALVFFSADPDLWLVIGLAMAVLVIPSLLSAWADGRVPRAGAITALIAGGLIALAMNGKSGGYALSEIPVAITEVLGRILN